MILRFLPGKAKSSAAFFGYASHLPGKTARRRVWKKGGELSPRAVDRPSAEQRPQPRDYGFIGCHLRITPDKVPADSAVT